MPLFDRAVEALETVARMAFARARPVRALERFLAAHRPESLPADEAGLWAEPLPPAQPALVSIVILTLNGGEMLRALFASLERFNTWPDIEIIVVDHGTDDETKNVIAAASTKFHIRHVKPGRNYSFAFSCNRGAQIARGEIVLFLNNDIELTEDVIPPVVAGVQATGGLVGIRLIRKQPGGRTMPRPHIGVRFRWNLRRGWTAPYDALPGPRDALRAAQPCRMPAETGAVLACNRAEFLAMGGFCEDYLYAYEDVDLCLKAAARFDRPSIALNNVAAVHLMGATRIKRANLRRRIRWHRHSRAVLRARYGYRNRRLAWLGLFGVADGFDWGRRPAIAVLADKADEAASRAAASLADEFGEFATLKQPGFGQYDLFGYDLVLSRLPRFSFAHARNLGPMALKLGWLGADDSDWADNAAACDILIADDEGAAARWAAKLGRPVAAIGTRSLGDALRDIVAGFLRERLRVVVLVPESGSAVATNLCNAMISAGHAVRVAKAQARRQQVSIRDDVAIWLALPGMSALAADTIHVAAFGKAPGAGFSGDIRVESLGADFPAWFDRLMSQIADCHERRMAGPVDLPLEDLSGTDDAASASVWRARHDPTAHLIGLS